MKSFIEYVATEEKIPSIPKQQMKEGNYTSKILELNDGNYDIEVLTTKQSAINYIISNVFNANSNFPLTKIDFFHKEYGTTKEDWERAWKDWYEDVTARNEDDEYVGFVIGGKYYNLEDVSFDELVYIIKHLNQLEYFYLEAGWGDVVFGGVIQPLDPFEDDEESLPHINSDFDKWITDDRYEIKKIGKTEVVMKDKKNNIKYFK